MKKVYFVIITTILCNSIVNAQIALNTSGDPPDASAAWDIQFTNKGILIPRVSLSSTSDGTTITNPATSLLVYNTNASITGGQGVGYYYNAGTPASPNWVKFLAGKEAWMITGNDNTTAPTSGYGTPINNNFIGTTNAVDFAIATNNIERMRIKTDDGSNLRIGMGTAYTVNLTGTGNPSILHLHDWGTTTNDYSQLNISTSSTNVGRVGVINFAATQVTNEKRLAAIESYLTNYTAPDASGDLRFYTNYANTFRERMRLYETGQLVLSDNSTFPSPTANYLFTIYPTTNSYRSGISIPMSGATSTAYAIYVTSANAKSRGYFYENTSGSYEVFYGAGAQLSTKKIVSGYLAYRNSSGFSYGIYGINGTNASYATNDSTWAAFIQGRAVISSESRPTSPLGVDLEIRNTTVGFGNPATLSMRQTTQESTTGRILARLNFGDNYTTDPQAQISIIREAAGGSGDYPTAILFSNTPDGSSTLTERMRISNNGNVGINITSPTHRLHVYNNTNSISAIYGDNSNISSSGTDWSYGSSNVSAIQGISTSGNYTAGIYGYRYATGTNGAGVLGAWSSVTWGCLGCEENSNRWGIFTPVNAAIRGYLLVGNPSTPSVNSGSYSFYKWTSWNDLAGWTWSQVCGTGQWNLTYSTYDDNGINENIYINFTPVGSRSRALLYSPWIWIPSIATNTKYSLVFSCHTEDNYDGVFVEYSFDGSTWTKVTTFLAGQGYPDNANGSNTSCTGNGNQSCWNGELQNGDIYYADFEITGDEGKWVRLRFTGMEDGSVSSGDGFKIFGLSVYGNLPSISTFLSGNIYAEYNVFAGSNALLGDLAEYFKVEGFAKPGMLISIDKNKNNSFRVANKPYDDNLIGIYSKNPTLTLNDPKSGIPVALSGRVPVLVTAANSEIKVGDYLTSSFLEGVAMKADKPCYVIGVALEPYYKNEVGEILCLIKPGWYNNNTAIASGNFKIPSNASEITVYDKNIKKDSKIFVSLLDNPEAFYWIKEKNNNSFTLAFSNTLKKDIKFDYLIENAQMNNSNNIQKKEKEIFVSDCKPDDFEYNSEWRYDEQKKVYWKPKKITSTSKIPIFNESSNTPPSIPENQNNAYFYDPVKKEIKVTLNYSEFENQEKFKQIELQEKIKEQKDTN